MCTSITNAQEFSPIFNEVSQNSVKLSAENLAFIDNLNKLPNMKSVKLVSTNNFSNAIVNGRLQMRLFPTDNTANIDAEIKENEQTPNGFTNITAVGESGGSQTYINIVRTSDGTGGTFRYNGEYRVLIPLNPNVSVLFEDNPSFVSKTTCIDDDEQSSASDKSYTQILCEKGNCGSSTIDVLFLITPQAYAFLGGQNASSNPLQQVLTTNLAAQFLPFLACNSVNTAFQIA